MSRLKGIVQDYFTIDSCHDIYHLKRVHNLALKLQFKEGGDKYVIGVASFLHDVHRIIQVQQGSYCLPKDSLDTVNKMLIRAEVNSEKIPAILRAIEFHEEYSFSEQGKTVDDIETLILQDADNLDAIGAIGIARAFSYGGLHNMPIWNPDISISNECHDESSNSSSVVHHFYSKLFKLGENMNTSTAKAMATSRIEYMHKFVDIFLSEWKVEI